LVGAGKKRRRFRKPLAFSLDNGPLK
jgi:hypothetical protein